jgi:hypothetical protein
MKSDVFFISGSFDFDSPIEELFSSLIEASVLVEKFSSEGFVKFSNSSDFYNDVIDKLYGPNSIPESGLLAALIYDGGMSKAAMRELTSNEIVDYLNQDVAAYEGFWLSIYGSLPDSITINNPERNVLNEIDIIEYSKSIIISNDYNSDGYADAFKGIYRNIEFHPNYNNIKNITGGCNNFINGILEMFDVINSRTPKDGDVKEDIDFFEKNIKFTTCEEGGGKKKRKTEDKKLNFTFSIDGVESLYNCEYHCKLEYIDKQYKKGKYHKDNRMYFGFYKPEGKKKSNKTLIAHLGGHL